MNKRLDEIRQRLGKATEGEWELKETPFGSKVLKIGDCWSGAFYDNDYEFISNSKQDIAYLLSLVEKQREAIEEALEGIKRHDEAYYQCESEEGAT